MLLQPKLPESGGQGGVAVLAVDASAGSGYHRVGGQSRYQVLIWVIVAACTPVDQVGPYEEVWLAVGSLGDNGKLGPVLGQQGLSVQASCCASLSLGIGGVGNGLLLCKGLAAGVGHSRAQVLCRKDCGSTTCSRVQQQ